MTSLVLNIYYLYYLNTIVLECANDVCGMRREDGQRRKGSEWCNEEVGRAVTVKRSAFE